MSKEPRWKVEVDIEEDEWIESPAENNDQIVKEGHSILAIVNEILNDLAGRVPIEDV